MSDVTYVVVGGDCWRHDLGPSSPPSSPRRRRNGRLTRFVVAGDVAFQFGFVFIVVVVVLGQKTKRCILGCQHSIVCRWKVNSKTQTTKTKCQNRSSCFTHHNIDITPTHAEWKLTSAVKLSIYERTCNYIRTLYTPQRRLEDDSAQNEPYFLGCLPCLRRLRCLSLSRCQHRKQHVQARNTCVHTCSFKVSYTYIRN